MEHDDAGEVLDEGVVPARLRPWNPAGIESRSDAARREPLLSAQSVDLVHDVCRALAAPRQPPLVHHDATQSREHERFQNCPFRMFMRIVDRTVCSRFLRIALKHRPAGYRCVDFSHEPQRFSDGDDYLFEVGDVGT